MVVLNVVSRAAAINVTITVVVVVVADVIFYVLVIFKTL